MAHDRDSPRRFCAQAVVAWQQFISAAIGA
jgi:hypothetical protein